jgi:hypothetical protein
MRHEATVEKNSFNRFNRSTSDLSEDGFDFRKRQESAWLQIAHRDVTAMRCTVCAWLPLRGYFLRLFNRVRSSFIESGLLSPCLDQLPKLDEVCRATSVQSLPSTPTRMAAGLPRRVMTTLSCWDISTHSLILFCRSRALTGSSRSRCSNGGIYCKRVQAHERGVWFSSERSLNCSRAQVLYFACHFERMRESFPTRVTPHGSQTASPPKGIQSE